MELIEDLLNELTDAARDYNMDQIDKTELNLNLQLIISKIDKIEINFYVSPLDKLVTKRHTKYLNQLLFKSKHKAVQSLITLIETNYKQLFLVKMYPIQANKLYFNSLYRVLDNSCKAYISRNQLKQTPEQIHVFIYNTEG